MSKNRSTGAQQPPSPRRDRREAARRDQRLAAARTSGTRPAWQSPTVLLSIGAVAVGLVVIILASGVLGRGAGPAAELLIPIRPAPPELADPVNPRALGPADAPVTVEVWSDFQCSACSFWARQVKPDLVEEYVRAGSVRVVYRDFAFLDGGDAGGESQQAAAAARCAGEQGTFWPYHDYLMENHEGVNDGAFRRERLDQIASAVGLDMAAFGSCMAGDAPEQAVQDETAQGRAAGVDSTPRLAINGVLQAAGALPMADSASGPGLRALIDAELARVSPAPEATPSPAP
ncbi:MAG TPA: thioredoxin domain-containing protein [Patescibacteria group bacterium]|nr:thioredoxin domain-containing protein [Patescibacteria group bacterium]